MLFIYNVPTMNKIFLLLLFVDSVRLILGLTVYTICAVYIIATDPVK